MKNHKLLLAFLCCITLTACGNTISQEDFNSLKSEKESLQLKYDKLNEDFQKIKDEYVDKLEEKKVALNDEYTTQLISAWTTTSFGENTKFSISDDFLHVLVYTDTTVTTDGINDIMNKFLSSAKYYKITYDSAPEQMKFNTVSITYLDAEDNQFLNLSFSKSGDTFDLNNILIDSANIETIVTGLSSKK